MAQKSEIINPTVRNIIQPEKNMVVRFKLALKVIEELKIPVYRNNPSEHFCHFSDVLKRLCKLALIKKKHGNFDCSGINIKQLRALREQWAVKFPLINTKQKLDYFDSGKVMAGMFLVTVAKSSIIRKTIRNRTRAVDLQAEEIEARNKRREK
jgi:hypothetical protein